MKTAILKPAEGVKLFDPKTNQFLPKSGKRVTLDQYWTRRIADGGAILVEEKPEKKSVTKEKSDSKTGGKK